MIYFYFYYFTILNNFNKHVKPITKSIGCVTHIARIPVMAFDYRATLYAVEWNMLCAWQSEMKRYYR